MKTYRVNCTIQLDVEQEVELTDQEYEAIYSSLGRNAVLRENTSGFDILYRELDIDFSDSVYIELNEFEEIEDEE